MRPGIGILVGLAVITCLLVACGGDGEEAPQTDVTLTFSEWEIAVEPAQARAGDVTFTLENTGELAHNLVIVKSDLPPGELPQTDGAVNESKLNVEGGAGPIAPGPAPEGDAGYTETLSPGKYVLYCNVVAQGESHYRNGMYASFLVEP